MINISFRNVSNLKTMNGIQMRINVLGRENSKIHQNTTHREISLLPEGIF